MVPPCASGIPATRAPVTGRSAGAGGADAADAVEMTQEHAMDAIFSVPEPRNEPVRDYAPGSPEREALKGEIVLAPPSALAETWALVP